MRGSISGPQGPRMWILGYFLHHCSKKNRMKNKMCIEANGQRAWQIECERKRVEWCDRAGGGSVRGVWLIDWLIFWLSTCSEAVVSSTTLLNTSKWPSRLWETNCTHQMRLLSHKDVNQDRNLFFLPALLHHVKTYASRHFATKQTHNNVIYILYGQNWDSHLCFSQTSNKIPITLSTFTNKDPE